MAFLYLKLLLCLLLEYEAKKLLSSWLHNWPHPCCTDVICQVSNIFWCFPLHPGLHFQGLEFHSALQSLDLAILGIESQVLKNRGLSDALIPMMLRAIKKGTQGGTAKCSINEFIMIKKPNANSQKCKLKALICSHTTLDGSCPPEIAFLSVRKQSSVFQEVRRATVGHKARCDLTPRLG